MDTIIAVVADIVARVRCALGRHTSQHATDGPYRLCGWCGTSADLATEPPAGHPDSMTRELPDHDEEWLAAMDAAYFPEETPR